MQLLFCRFPGEEEEERSLLDNEEQTLDEQIPDPADVDFISPDPPPAAQAPSEGGINFCQAVLIPGVIPVSTYRLWVM